MTKNIRETSTDSYNKIKQTIGERQEIVLRSFMANGASTDYEIAYVLGYTDPNKVRPRRFELVKMGYMIESKKRECSISGRKVFTWIRTKKKWADKQ